MSRNPGPNEQKILGITLLFRGRGNSSAIKNKNNRHKEEYIADYCHENTHSQNMAVMDVAGEAWDELLPSCETCPNRCISERSARSKFFDRIVSFFAEALLPAAEALLPASE